MNYNVKFADNFYPPHWLKKQQLSGLQVKALSTFLFYLLLTYSNYALSIVNIENTNIQSEKQTEGIDTKFSFDINGNNGNTKDFEIGLGIRSQWYEETSTRFFLLNHEYCEYANVRDTNRTFIHFRNIWNHNDEISWELFTQLQDDEFTRLKLRALLGGGARVRLLKEDDNSSHLGLGIFREKEKLEFAAATTDTGVSYTNRLNLYLVYNQALSNHSKLVSTLYYQPSIDDTADYRLLEQIGLELDITENLSFNVSVNIKRDSRPPQLTKKTDTTYTTGFEYDF